jgi:hypothetical protein
MRNLHDIFCPTSLLQQGDGFGGDDENDRLVGNPKRKVWWSLEEPSEYSIIATILGSLADRSGFAGSERRVEPEGPMKMFRLPIVNSISWFSSIPALLLAKSKKPVKFMIPTSKVPTVGANWWGVNSTNVLNEGLRIGEIRRRMNSKVKLVGTGVYRK